MNFDDNEEDCTIYIEELKSDDPNLKMNAVVKVTQIAEILGKVDRLHVLRVGITEYSPITEWKGRILSTTSTRFIFRSGGSIETARNPSTVRSLAQNHGPILIFYNK